MKTKIEKDAEKYLQVKDGGQTQAMFDTLLKLLGKIQSVKTVLRTKYIMAIANDFENKLGKCLAEINVENGRLITTHFEGIIVEGVYYQTATIIYETEEKNEPST